MEFDGRISRRREFPAVKLEVFSLGGPYVAIAGLREHVEKWEDLGLDGIFAGDHLFLSAGRDHRNAIRPTEPFTLLSAIGALSDRLILGTCAINIGFYHPVIAFRAFAQLAALYGGERVVAGIGAGWNAEEISALGWTFPTFSQRMDKLEDACVIARQLFDNGFADHEGSQAAVHDLPLAPQPAKSPQLLLCGGSDRLLELAGRFADAADLHGSSRRLKVGGADAEPLRRDAIRMLTTTTDDLVRAAKHVWEVATATGRDPDRIAISNVVWRLKFCSAGEVEATEIEICRQAGVEQTSLRECPYAFVGEPGRMRDLLAERVDRIGLKRIIVPQSTDGERFIKEVVRP